MNRFFQSHVQNLQLTTVKMAYVTCLVTKNFTFELPGKCDTETSRDGKQRESCQAEGELGVNIMAEIIKDLLV